MSEKSRIYLSIIVVAIIFSCLNVTVVCADEIKVAVASNFSKAIQNIAEQYSKKSKHKIVLIFGSTGKHYAQIKNGAPFDIFLAADDHRPKLLEQEGYVVDKTRSTYAIGKIVLWSPKLKYVDPHGEILKSKQFAHLAMANPKLAPYGKAASEIISTFGLEPSLNSRLVYGENIAQTFQFVRSGVAELGFVSWSQIYSSRKKPDGSWWNVPQELYTPIKQELVILKDSKAIRDFIKFLFSKEGKDIITSNGYGVL